MALKKPLVLSGGLITQLQSGDTLDATISETEGQVYTNGDVAGHVIGDAVYLSAADTVKKATASAPSTTRAIAIATASIANGVPGTYQTSGSLGGLSGLTAGAVYYLSPTTAGLLTLTPPSTLGQYVVEIGVATSTTEILINIQAPILL